MSFDTFEDGYIKMAVSDKISPDFILNLHKILENATGKPWKIDTYRGTLKQTLFQKENAKLEEERRDIMESPLVKAIMAEFKGARIETIIRKVAEDDSQEDENIFTSENDTNFNYDEE